jgi:hypothetical protein
LEGWKIRDIADELRISEKTVDRWWSVYRKERWGNVLLDGLTERIPELYAGKYGKSGLVADTYETTDYFLTLRKKGAWLYFTAAGWIVERLVAK